MAYVLLDRDGVINEDSEAFIKSPSEWIPIPGSLEAIALLNRHGYRVAVITNQSGIARGLYDQTTLARIHAKMLDRAQQAGGSIEAIYYCPHGPHDGCTCRKPKAGLLKALAQAKGIDLIGTPLIGDSWRDMQAARAVGARPLLVRTGKGEKTLKNHPELDVSVFQNLYEAAKYLIATQ